MKGDSLSYSIFIIINRKLSYYNMKIIFKERAMGKGFIKVQLFTAKDVFPISGGNIFIIESTAIDFDKGKVLTTDDCGVSKTQSVTTPDKSVSENSASTEVPYALYDIYVRVKGYRDAAVEGVQVFPDVISIQKIEMIPTKKERVFLEEPEFNCISSHQLMILSPRDKIEGAKAGTCGIVQPYIPENITVHLGAPTSYAENVTLSFLEYIKNVACSEIYPTWPEAAIKANIYAEISFALNRVYTSWYRNMGHAFEVTNSTAYDQSFVKGRNIYENIARIVDDIFNEYITGGGSKEPLLAQYCNGTTVTCTGLSQWGTVSLANNGYGALDILKNYYGNDIVFERANDIKGIEEPYGGTELKIGSTGKDVEVIQSQLNRIAKNHSSIKKIEEVNGEFCENTEKAVKAFQEIYNLNSNGIVGRATWCKLALVNNTMRKIAELHEEGEKEYNKGVCPEYLLRYGDSGTAVREFQCYLSLIGQYYSVIPPIMVNGEFEVNTKAAVLAFQKKFNNIDVDGIVGKQTWDKMYEIYCDLR